MKQKRLYWFLNFICIAAMLVTGLCFCDVRSDAACPQPPSGCMQAITSVDIPPVSGELLPAELSGSTKYLSMRAQTTPEDTEHAYCHSFSLPSALPALSNHLYPDIRGFAELSCMHTAFSRTCIIAYIHRQDGSKS